MKSMLSTPNQEIEGLLQNLAEGLDIPDHLYEDATLKYEDVSEFLAAEDSELRAYTPEIFPQGSFRLGTVVKPLTRADEYDIDLVCHLHLKKESITQKDLKEMVGRRLKKREDLEKILEPSRRCWTLSFPKQFHMDVLPAIPNIVNPPSGILLTDTELKLWQSSDPISYAEWFKSRMKTILLEQRAILAKSLEANIEDIPEWRIRTPLQRAVQLLKRHRDKYFQGKENKPTSIIITTLSARSYEGQANIVDALTTIAMKMPSFIERRNDKWWIPNPVDANENFADKWNEKPERKEAFIKWLEQVQMDFFPADAVDIRKSFDRLKPVLGEDIVATAANRMGVAINSSVPVAISIPQVPALADSGHSKTPPWDIKPSYRATMKATVHPRPHNKKKLWNLADRPIPKNVGIRFRVETNTPSPFKVHWQVVNTGNAARAVGGLRGGFYDSDDEGGNIRWEGSEYPGTHWIEAFIIKEGVCVARTGRKYVKIRG